MTANGDSPIQESPPRRPRTRSATPSPVRLATSVDICPYLVAGDGTWQSAQPARDQRCGALEPPVPLAPQKQRQLCLVAEHRSCATYLAAQQRAAAAAPGGPAQVARDRADDTDAGMWPPVRSALVVLDAERRLPGLGGSRVRASSQVALITLMGVAFLLLVVSRTGPTQPPAGGSPSAVAQASPSPAATRSPSPSPTARAATPSPAASATVSPPPTARADQRRYRVRSGDTLSGIALRFGTTVKVLKRINDIQDPSLLRPGQVILVPRR